MKHTSGTEGFSLIQITILLTIAAMILATMLPSSQNSVTKKNQVSSDKTNQILVALRGYEAAYGRLPCPADPTLPSGSANYGVEASNAGPTNNCIGASPAAAYADATNHIAIGMVPVKTLALPNDAALDGFGRDISYLVDTNATIGCWSTQPGTITVSDEGTTSTQVVALISHGADGYGAWVPLQGASGTASRLDTGCTNCNSEADNAQIARGGGTTALGNGAFKTLVIQSPTSSPIFDDTIVYNSTLWDLKTSTSYWTKSANNALLAVAHSVAPYVTMYNFCGNSFTKLPAPATAPTGTGYAVSFSRDNSMLAWGGDHGSSTNEGYLYSVSQSGLTYSSVFATSSYDLMVLQFSNDSPSSYLAYGGDFPYGTVAMKSGSTYTTSGVTGYNLGRISYGFAWSSDNATLYSVPDSWNLTVYSRSGNTFSLKTGMPANPLDLTSYGLGAYVHLFDASLDPTDTYLAIAVQSVAAGYYYPIVLKNPSSGSPTNISATGHYVSGANNSDLVTGVAWSPSGKFLATMTFNGYLYVYSFDSSTDSFTLATISGGSFLSSVGSKVAWSSDSKYLSVTTSSPPYLYVFSRSGTTFTPMSIPALPGVGYRMAWSH